MPGQHDSRYKFLFSNPLFVKRLLKSFVHEKFVNRLDFSTLQRVDKSFITEDFREKESDIIWKIDYERSPVYIFLLLEFQSTVDKLMPLRFLRYITEFYQSFTGKTETGKLPAVLPVLLYNGDKKWTAEISIEKIIEEVIPKKYIPHFSYYPVIINEIPNATLLKIRNALSAVFYAENASTEELAMELDTLFEIIKNEEIDAISIFIRWLNNYFASLGVERIIDIEQISDITEVKGMLATRLKEYGRRLKEEGREEGREEERERSRRETALKMKEKGFSIEQIIEITGLSSEEVEKL
jgi:predicted transposase/invertase (TIGR01784 family)